ncbi:hypothetical protein HDV00_010916, partial [Rhizophlyctis rosea]
LHLAVLDFLLKVTPERAWHYVQTNRTTFARNLTWLNHVKARFPILKKACYGQDESIDSKLDFLAFELMVECDIAHATLAQSQESQTAISDFERAVEDSDYLLPFGDDKVAAALRWSQIRQEYVAHVQTLKALLELKRIGRQGFDPKTSGSHIHAAFQYLFVSLSYKPKTITHNLQSSASDRISLTAHILLPFLVCFDLQWLLSRYRSSESVFAQATSTAEEAAVLPSWKSLHLTVDFRTEMDGGNVKLAMGLLEFIRIGGLWKADERCLARNPWDLERMLMAATWHLQSGELRNLLRSVFPRLPEKPPLRGTPRSSRRPLPTIADMEAFLLILLIQRHVSLCGTEGATSVGQVLFFSALREWRPHERQVAFWGKALKVYGKTDHTHPHLLTAPLTDREFNHVLREIRGSVQLPKEALTREERIELDSAKRMVYGLVGLQYEKMVREGTDCIGEAQSYLGVWSRWEEEREERWDVGGRERSGILFGDGDAGVTDGSMFGVTEEKVEAALTRVTESVNDRFPSLPEMNEPTTPGTPAGPKSPSPNTPMPTSRRSKSPSPGPMGYTTPGHRSPFKTPGSVYRTPMSKTPKMATPSGRDALSEVPEGGQGAGEAVKGLTPGLTPRQKRLMKQLGDLNDTPDYRNLFTHFTPGTSMFPRTEPPPRPQPVTVAVTPFRESVMSSDGEEGSRQSAMVEKGKQPALSSSFLPTPPEPSGVLNTSREDGETSPDQHAKENGGHTAAAAGPMTPRLQRQLGKLGALNEQKGVMMGGQGLPQHFTPKRGEGENELDFSKQGLANLRMRGLVRGSRYGM